MLLRSPETTINPVTVRCNARACVCVNDRYTDVRCAVRRQSNRCHGHRGAPAAVVVAVYSLAAVVAVVVVKAVAVSVAAARRDPGAAVAVTSSRRSDRRIASHFHTPPPPPPSHSFGNVCVLASGRPAREELSTTTTRDRLCRRPGPRFSSPSDFGFYSPPAPCANLFTAFFYRIFFLACFLSVGVIRLHKNARSKYVENVVFFISLAGKAVV